MFVLFRLSLLAAAGLVLCLPWQAADAGKRQGARLCFFSYNNASEFETVHRFVQQLNRQAPAHIEVVELQAFDSDPEDAIRAAARSGLHCDGLVLSGHQRKRKFWGERSDGSIKSRHFEQLSCANDTADWFLNVKAVWLQGCTTGHQDLLRSEIKPKKRIDDLPQLIREKLDPRDLEDSLDDINDRIEANLNSDNIAVDYLRIFPQATLYTWTNKAPGEKAGSQNSLLYHVAQVARLAGAAGEQYQDPRGRLGESAARRYGEALYAMLTGVAPGAGGLNEANFIRGWHAHGDYRQKYAFDNHELKAFAAMLHADAPLLRQNRGLRCLLRNYRGQDRIEDMVAYIARHDHLAPYNDLALQAMIDSSGPEHQPALLRTLSGSARLMTYLAQASSQSRPDAAHLHARLRAAKTSPAAEQGDDAAGSTPAAGSR